MKKVRTLSKDIETAIRQIRPLFAAAKRKLEQELGREMTDAQAFGILFRGVHTQREVSHEFTVQQVAAAENMPVSKIRAELRKYRQTGGKDGLGPVSRYGHRTLRIPAEAVRRWQERHLAAAS